VDSLGDAPYARLEISLFFFFFQMSIYLKDVGGGGVDSRGDAPYARLEMSYTRTFPPYVPTSTRSRRLLTLRQNLCFCFCTSKARTFAPVKQVLLH
jgi:hypothetical protein